MDLIFRLIEFIVQALLDQSNQKKPPATAAPPRSQPGAQMAAARPQAGARMPPPPSPARANPLAPRTQVTAPDPFAAEDTWRRVLTLLGIIVLIIIVALWFMYTQGWI